MYRADLITLCEPMKPEKVLQHLTELQEALEKSAWGTEEDLQAVTAGVKVLTAVLPGDPGMTLEQQRQRGFGRD